jgi:SnoaL-like domain
LELALYAPDAVIESPLIPYLMGLERAITGHAEIRAFWEKLAERKPPVRSTTEAVCSVGSSMRQGRIAPMDTSVLAELFFPIRIANLPK